MIRDVFGMRDQPLTAVWLGGALVMIKSLMRIKGETTDLNRLKLKIKSPKLILNHKITNQLLPPCSKYTVCFVFKSRYSD